MVAREIMGKMNNIDLTVHRAEAPYKTLQMKDIKGDYQGPPKYLNQRDAPLEIPLEVVKKLFEAVDADVDDRITLEELQNYVE